MAVKTAAGSTISIGTKAADAATDTYTLIGEVVSIGEYGKTYNEISHLPLSTRAKQKFKGSYDDGNLSLNLGNDLEDDGQAAALVALDDDDAFNFRIEYNDKATPSGHGSYRYFKGRVMSFKESVPGTDSIIGATCAISIQSGTITRVSAT
jgi:hypothetical protein